MENTEIALNIKGDSERVYFEEDGEIRYEIEYHPYYLFHTLRMASYSDEKILHSPEFFALENLIKELKPDILDTFQFVAKQFFEKSKTRLTLYDDSHTTFFTGWNYYIEADKVSDDKYNLYYSVDDFDWSMTFEYDSCDEFYTKTFVDKEIFISEIDDAKAEKDYNLLTNNGIRDELGRCRLLSALEADWEKALRFVSFISNDEGGFLNEAASEISESLKAITASIQSLYGYKI